MKYLLSFSVLFFITGCGNPEHFASVSEDSSLIEASKQPEYKKEIKALVKKDAKVKIAGKKRQKLNVADTVGENNLKKDKKNVTHIDVTSEIVVKKAKQKKKTAQTVTVTHEQKTVVEVSTKTATKTAEVEEKPVDLGPKLNVLVYMHKRAYGSCVNHLKRSHKSFLEALSAYDWTISFAYYTDVSEAELMALETRGGRLHDKNKKFFKFEKDIV